MASIIYEELLEIRYAFIIGNTILFSYFSHKIRYTELLTLSNGSLFASPNTTSVTAWPPMAMYVCLIHKEIEKQSALCASARTMMHDIMVDDIASGHRQWNDDGPLTGC